MSDGKTTLYRLYNGRGDLLYVGIAANFPRRLAQHHATKPWASEVVTHEVHDFPTRDEALEAEREAIQWEEPRYNVIHKGTGVPVDTIDVKVPVVEQVRGICTGCERVIPPGGGYLELDIDHAYRSQEARTRGLDGLRDGDAVAADWQRAPWLAWCNACKPEETGRSDVIELRTLTCMRDLAWHTSEVMAKFWGPWSNWTGMLSSLGLNGKGGCLVLTTDVPEARVRSDDGHEPDPSMEPF